MDLEKIVAALTLEDAPDDIFDQIIPKEGISFENTIKLFTDLSGRVESSLTLKFLSKFMVEYYFKFVKLHRFGALYPSEQDFSLKVLQIFTAKHVDKVLALHFSPLDEQETTAAPQIEPSMLTEIYKMKNLIELHITQCYVTLRDLIELGKNLPELNQIRVRVDSKTPPEDDQLMEFAKQSNKIFGKLESINLVAKGNEVDRTEEMHLTSFEKISYQCLPNIKRVRSWRYFFDASKGGLQMEREVRVRWQKWWTSAINLMELNDSQMTLLPYLQIIVVEWDEWNKMLEPKLDYQKLKQLLERAKNCTFLIFQDLISPECLEFILKNFGENLNTLRLENYLEKMNVDLNLIQENCTKLENLIIRNGVEYSKSLSNFTSLRSLQITFRNHAKKKELLSNILAAPNLETVRLSNFLVSTQDMNDTISLVASQAILTKVTSLVLRMYNRTCKRLDVAKEPEGKLFKTAVLGIRQNEAEVEVDFIPPPSSA